MSESATPPSASAVSEIEAVVRDYIEGWYVGDAARMDRALHPDLVKRIPEGAQDGRADALRTVSKLRMMELTAGGGGEDPTAEYEIAVDDVSQEIASARVLSPEYLDYLHLVKTPTGWKIANVLFRTRD